MKSKISILIAVLALAAMSCKENDIVWNSKDLDGRPLEFSAPVAKVHVPLYQTMLKKLDFDDLFVNDDGVICVRYTQSENVAWNDEIGIDDYTTSGAWKYPVNVTVAQPGGVTFPETVYQVDLKTSEASDSYISEADLTKGAIKLSVAVPAGVTKYNITAKIPELTKNGVEFSYDITPANQSTPIPLAGYKIKADNKRLNVHYVITVYTSSSVSGDIVFTLSISDMEVSYMAGYFGELTYNNAEGEISLNFFDELDFDGAIGIKDIGIKAVVTNNAGIPMKADGSFSFANEIGFEKPVVLTPPFSFSVPAATESGANHAVTPKVGTFSTTASTIEFANKQQYPTKLKYKVSGQGNPDGNVGGNVRNFIVKTGDALLANADIILTIPLHLKVESFSRTDDTDFDYNDLVGNNEDYVNKVEYVTVNLTVNNGLPFDVTLETFATNESGTYSSQIGSDMAIAAKTNGQTFEIKLTDVQLEQFRTEEVKKIVIHTQAKTKNVDYVTVTENDVLDIDVKARIKAEIPSNIFD